MAILTDIDSRGPDARKQYNDGWLGILSTFAVVWGLLNLFALTLSMTQGADDLARHYTAEQVALMMSTPVWAEIAHAVSVVMLLVGAVYLQLRKSSAYGWFMGSLFATLLMMLDGVLRGGFDVVASLSSGLNLGYVLVGVFLFWAAYSAKEDGQLPN